MKTSLLDMNPRRAANFSFSALLLVLFGWINIEILLLSRHAGYGGQLLTSVFGMSLSVIACRRYRTCWRPLAYSLPASALPPSWRARRMASGAALAAAGFVLAYAMRLGFLAAAVGAGSLIFFPWSRSTFCRKSFFLSQALLVAGGLPVLIRDAVHRHPVVLLADSWILWALAAGLLLATLRTKGSSIPAPGQAQAGPQVFEDSIR
jgi:hypothetical protein